MQVPTGGVDPLTGILTGQDPLQKDTARENLASGFPRPRGWHHPLNIPKRSVLYAREGTELSMKFASCNGRPNVGILVTKSRSF